MRAHTSPPNGGVTLSTSIKGVRGRALGIAVAIAVFAAPAIADAKKPIKPSKPTVMTRNLYLGADLGPAIAAPSVPAAYTAIGDIWDTMRDNNFNARAKLLANEIEDDQPDLIGLQEVSIWRRDDVVDGPATPATEVVYDYLELLQDELARRGLAYKVVVVQQEADLEFPADTSGDGNPDFDGRLTMRDVILAKEKVKVLDTQSANYPINASVTTPAFGSITVRRGWTSADVRIDKRNAKGTKFRFINTHLESFNAFVRNLQAQDLTISAGVTDSALPTVLVGDLNSDPDDPSTDPGPPSGGNNDAYESVVADGFSDYGVEVNTCCHDEDLLNDPPAAFTSRIDHVMGKGNVSELSSKLIGDWDENRSGFGLWPTDHGGVVSQLLIGATP